MRFRFGIFWGQKAHKLYPIKVFVSEKSCHWAHFWIRWSLWPIKRRGSRTSLLSPFETRGAIRSLETYINRGMRGTSRVTQSGLSSHFNPLEDDNLHTIKVRGITHICQVLAPLCGAEKHTASLSATRERSFPYIWIDNPDVICGSKSEQSDNCWKRLIASKWSICDSGLRLYQGKEHRGVEKF